MSRRSRAREIVLQVLYQDDLNPPGNPEANEDFLRKRLNDDPTLIAFAASLLSGVGAHRDELDKLLVERTENWSLGRMAATDRNVLRLGAYEILFTETPDRVAINEAVELAKRFGAKQSPQFVNGILDRFLQKPRVPGQAAAVSSESAILAAASRLSAPSEQEATARVPAAEEFARALAAIAERPAERKFPAYFRTLLKTHCESGPQTAAEIAEAMGWDNAVMLLARYGELGKRVGEELHFDPPLYDDSGGPLWISVLALAASADESLGNGRWELRREVAAALELLGWA